MQQQYYGGGEDCQQSVGLDSRCNIQTGPPVKTCSQWLWYRQQSLSYLHKGGKVSSANLSTHWHYLNGYALFPLARSKPLTDQTNGPTVQIVYVYQYNLFTILSLQNKATYKWDLYHPYEQTRINTGLKQSFLCNICCCRCYHHLPQI